MADLTALLNSAGTPALPIPPVDPRPPVREASIAERMGLSHVDPEPYTAPAPPPLEAPPRVYTAIEGADSPGIDPATFVPFSVPVITPQPGGIGVIDLDEAQLFHDGRILSLLPKDALAFRKLALRAIAHADAARLKTLASMLGIKRRRGAAVPEAVGTAVPLETSPAPSPPTRRRRRSTAS